MGKVVFFLIAFLFLYKIYTCKSNSDKLSWYFAGIMFFPHSVALLQSPLLTFPRLIILWTLFVAAFQIPNLSVRIKRFPFKKSLALLFVLLLMIGLFDDRLSLFLKFYRPVIYFVENFIILIIPFLFMTSVKEVRTLFRRILLFFAVFAFYGLVTFFIKSNPYHTFISQSFGSIDYAMKTMENVAGVRSRVSSFSWHPIYYGLLMVYNILIMFFLKTTFNIRRFGLNYFWIFLLIAFANLLLVNSRTPILALLMSGFLFYMLSTSLFQKMKILFTSVIVAFFCILLVPQVSKIIEESLNLLSGANTNLQEASSSIEMREVQLAASLIVFSEKPLTGHGFAYISEGLGYSGDKESRTSSSDFYGFESYSYKLLIEQGMFGIIGNIFLFFSMFTFFIRIFLSAQSDLSKRLAVLSVSFLVGFLLFIFGTGDLLSFTVTFSLIGLLVRTIYIEENRISSKKLNLRTIPNE